MDVLGAAIEVVTGQALTQALRELVLDPLGLRDSGFGVADAEPERLVTHYADAGPRPIVMPPRHAAVHDGAAFAPGRIHDRSAYPSAGGGMAGTATDVLKALEALRAGHTWFVDAARELTVVALTNTGLEGLFGRFPAAVRDAVYAG